MRTFSMLIALILLGIAGAGWLFTGGADCPSLEASFPSTDTLIVAHLQTLQPGESFDLSFTPDEISRLIGSMIQDKNRAAIAGLSVAIEPDILIIHLCLQHIAFRPATIQISLAPSILQGALTLHCNAMTIGQVRLPTLLRELSCRQVERNIQAVNHFLSIERLDLGENRLRLAGRRR